MVGIPCVDLVDGVVENAQEELKVMSYVCDLSESALSPEINWQTLVGVAILGSFMILLFFYLAAVLFREEKTIAWVKMELFELISTVFIVIFLVILVQSICQFQAGFLFSDEQLAELEIENLDTGTHMYFMAGSYLLNVDAKLEKFMCIDMVGAVVADIGASTQFKVHPMGQGFQTTPFSGFAQPMKLLLNNGMIAILISFVVNQGFFNILKYSVVAFPKYFLPFGIVFRSFEPTRRFGGTLIALSITFMLIYPILFSVSFYITEVGLSGGFDTVIKSFEDTAVFGDAGAAQNVATMPYDVFGEIVVPEDGSTDSSASTILGEGLGLIGRVVEGGFKIFGSLFSITYFLIGGWIIWWVALVGFVLPAFNTIMLVYTMRSLGRVLGEPVDITSLTRVI